MRQAKHSSNVLQPIVEEMDPLPVVWPQRLDSSKVARPDISQSASNISLYPDDDKDQNKEDIVSIEMSASQ